MFTFLRLLFATILLGLVVLPTGAANAEAECKEFTCVNASHVQLDPVRTRITVLATLTLSWYDKFNVLVPNRPQFSIDTSGGGSGTFSFEAYGTGSFTYAIQACVSGGVALKDRCNDFEEYTYRIDSPEPTPEAVAAPAEGEIAFLTDMPGGDYQRLTNTTTVFQCKAACEADTACRAWTFVLPGYQGDSALCYLKSFAPQAFGNRCCSSGVRAVAAAPAQKTAPAAEPTPQFVLPAPAPSAGVDFTGIWQTESSSGGRFRMSLLQDRKGQVTGSYVGEAGSGDGSLERGVVIGDQLHAIWSQDGSKGRVLFTMRDDGNRFSGEWTEGDKTIAPGTADGSWDGTREGAAVFPEPEVAEPEMVQPPAKSPPPPLTGEPTMFATLTQQANVRAGPSRKAKVLRTLPGGTEVGIVDCEGGWCEVVVPGLSEAYISETLLDDTPTGKGGGGGAEPEMANENAGSPTRGQPEKPAAEAEQKLVELSFAGNWSTITDQGNAYILSLRQKGSVVTGSYQPGNGRIEGTVDDGGRLIYTWSQEGYAGSGVFRLADDGESFDGTFSNSADPFEVAGQWSGSRQ
jgi:hypothetical protein